MPVGFCHAVPVMRPALLLAFASLAALPYATAQPVVVLDEPAPPPDWALAERALLRAASDGTEAFAQKYLDPQGYLECVERWGGNDGPDDAMENFAGWTLLYALGGDEKVLHLFEKAWEGHLLQFTAAKAPGIPMAENGMYWREFVTAFDWEHTGEALAAFHLYGLARPTIRSIRLGCCASRTSTRARTRTPTTTIASTSSSSRSRTAAAGLK
ncbi:MAG: hypothetical protein R2724_12200 [Bryobacterales bacterium]